MDSCVCKYCGSPIEPAMIIYNKYGGCGLELYCNTCKKTEAGVEKDIYQWSHDFVINSGFDYFTDIEDETEKFQFNVAKICELLSWARKKGFCENAKQKRNYED